jgi:O-antigen ligase/tetratricopeptide (TPR) repeat protein
VVCHNAARAILVLVFLAAPWWFGGVTPHAQLWLYAGVAAAVVLWLIGILEAWITSTGIGTIAAPWTLLPAVLLVVCGAIQIIPIGADPLALRHAELWEWLNEEAFSFAGRELSVCPAATRLEAFRLCFAVFTMFLAANLFQSRASQLFLLTSAVVNGAVLATFGVVQKIFGNGLLFWVVPLTSGGTPFASYVNRNNAAGYLTMTLACGVGLLLASMPRTPDAAYSPSGRFDRRAAGPLALLSMIVLGVLAANSRGGIVALAAIGGATVFRVASLRHRRTMLRGLGIVALIAVVLLIALGFSGDVLERLATLRDVEYTDARPLHWADSLRALRDAPWLGLGLGTYHYAHKPYQSHVSNAWYYNADSEYVEWLVEGGFIAGVLWVVFIGLLFSLVRRLLAAEHLPAASAAGTVLLLTLVGQLVHAIGDFGISLPANQLLAAAICGMALGIDHRLRFAGHRGHPVDHRLRRVVAPLGGLLMLVATAAGMHELYWTHQSRQFRASLPSLGRPEPLTKHHADVALAKAPRLLKQRHDDPEFHFDVARLWLFQFRWQLREQMIESGADAQLAPDALWARTHPAQIYTLVSSLRQQGARVSLQELMPPGGRESFERAVQHLSLAKQACPLLPEADFLLGCLSPLREPEEAELYFGREVFLSPTDTELLGRVAILAGATGLTELAARCWRREAKLVPEKSSEIVARATDALGAAVVLDQVIPGDSAAMLLDLAERAGPLREGALDRADQILQGQSDPESAFLRGRAAELRGDLAAAIDHYQQAVNRLSLEVAWRVRLARVFEQVGRIPEALAEWKACNRIAPNRKDFRAEIVRLERLMMERAAKSID